MKVIEYQEIRLMKQSDKSAVHLVREKGGERLFVRKALQGQHIVYAILQACEHPFLPKVYEVSINNGVTTVLEEYIEGNTIGTDDLTETAACTALKELCSVLDFLHSKGIVNRDVKPSNILMARDGHIRLIDFDAARMMKEEAEQDTKLLGTQGYAPPEQYGFSQTDARADIYALGITIEKLLGYKARRLKYRSLIRKCTELNPGRRYQSAKEVKRALLLHQRGPASLVAVAAVVLLALGVRYMTPSALPAIENVSETEAATSPESETTADPAVKEATSLAASSSPRESGAEGRPPYLEDVSWRFAIDVPGSVSGNTMVPGTGAYEGAVVESVTYGGKEYDAGFAYEPGTATDGNDHFMVGDVVYEIAAEYGLDVGDVLTLTANYSKDAGSQDISISLIHAGILVSFDSNGGDPGSDNTSIIGTSYTEENGTLAHGVERTATRSGFLFDGWSTKRTGGEAVTPDTVFTEDTTVYAQWSDAEGGASPFFMMTEWQYAMNIPGYQTGTNVIPGTGPFEGSVVESVTYNGKVYTTGFEFEPNYFRNGEAHFMLTDIIRDLAAEYGLKVGDIVELTANYSKGARSQDMLVTLFYAGFHVSFDSNGGNPGRESSVIGYSYADENGTLGRELSGHFPYHPDGLAFTGWFTEKSGGEEITPDYVFTSDATVYAHWEEVGENS